ncbi:MAG: hypothetical protein JJU03_03905, partial [Idiomarina sp.]|nr:hypothetical protein [Idiomarina sp.]
AGSDPGVADTTICTANNCQTEFVSSGLEIETSAYTRAGNHAESIIRALSTGSDGSCQPRLQQQTLPVSIDLECRDPVTCATNQSFQLFDSQGSELADTGGTNALSFDENGELKISHTYTDVGALGLNAAVFLEEEPAPDTPPINDPEITLFGSSTQSFYSIPFELSITPYKDNANFDALEQAFTVAGEPFAASIESLNSDGNLTPSFGRESFSVGLSTSYVNSTQPGSNPTEINANQLDTSNTSQFVENGVALVDGLVWDEVGELELSASLTGYFSAPEATLDSIARPPGIFSRFIPAYFELGLSSVEDANTLDTCSVLPDFPFTYLSEPGIQVSFEVLARNAKGSLTRNYTTAYYADNNLDMAEFGLLSATHGDERFTNVLASTSWLAGRFTFNDDNFVYPRRTDHQPEGPYPDEQLGIRIANSDEDGTNFNSAEISNSGLEPMVPLEGELNLLYARLNLNDISGPENEALAVTGGVQVYAFINDPLRGDVDATPSFQPARFDSCTELRAERFNGIAGPNASLSGAATELTNGMIADSQFTWQLDGTFEPQSAELLYEYDIADQPWLGFPWRTVDTNESPQALAIFGQYRGNDRIIFWLERGL